MTLHACDFPRSGRWTVIAGLAGVALWWPAGLAAQAPAAPSESPKPPEASAPTDKRVEEVVALKYDRSPGTVVTARAKLAELKLPPDSVELFRLRMIAGFWKDAVPFIGTLPKEGQERAYVAVLTALDQAITTPAAGAGPEYSPVLMPEDVADISDMGPGLVTPEQLKLLASLLRKALAAEQSLEPLMQRLIKGTRWMGGTDRVKLERAGDLIIEMGRARDSLRLLPPLEPGKETASFGLLEKHAKQMHSRGRQEQKVEDELESWRLNQILLSSATCPPPITERAWRRQADLARFIPKEAFAEFLAKSVENGPPAVLELVKQVAAQVNDDRGNREPNLRTVNLRVQAQVAEAVVPLAEGSEALRYVLNRYALVWVNEAAYARRMYVPPQTQNVQTFDAYGNRLPAPPPPQQNNNQARPVALQDMLDSAPSEKWRTLVDVSLRPRLLSLEADLALKADNDERALPLVEVLAPLDSKEGLRLAQEVLRVWAKTRFRNRQQEAPTNPFFYGNTPRGIPLTRAMQQRNLEELTSLYHRVAALGLPLDRGPVTNAFVQAHSRAEVFQRESIESVFGKASEMDSALLADLLQTMRNRLAGQWRKPSVQQQEKTQRTDAQVDAELDRGYRLLEALTEEGLKRSAEDWRLTLVKAAAMYDWAEFQYGRKVDLAIYRQMREAAFAGFARASSLYAAQQATRERKDETAAIYQQWFNAELGATDAGQVTRQQDPDPAALQRIREAVRALPADAVARHEDLLAKSLASSANSAPAQLKPNYLKAALALVDESKEAGKIREAVAYYDGLLREFELDLRLDGDATVGHGAPFGAFLALRHTVSIERESQGGFSRFLRNDAKQNTYYYGGTATPPTDHRDVLEKGIREKLSDRFEILSISFHDPKVQTYGYGRAGWRETPLAYLLLKAKDPAVDKLPALQLNMDFSDQQGTVILPVVSPVVLLDAKEEMVAARPMANLEVTQTLDERALADGKLALEVKTTSAGLIPKFEDVFDFDPSAFKVEERNDSGPAVQRLSSDDGAALAAISERTWVIKLAYQARGDAATASFRFPQPKTQSTKVIYKRYRDADLVEVPPDVALVGLPLGNDWKAPFAWAGGVLVAAVGLVVVLRRQHPRRAEAVATRYAAPKVVTPFSTLELLRKIQGDDALKLPESMRTELFETIARVESSYFSEKGDGVSAPDLSQVIGDWLTRPVIRNAAA